MLFFVLASSSFVVVSKSKVYQMTCVCVSFLFFSLFPFQNKTATDIPTGAFSPFFKGSFVTCLWKPLPTSLSVCWSAEYLKTITSKSLYLTLPGRRIGSVHSPCRREKFPHCSCHLGFQRFLCTKTLNGPEGRSSKAKKKTHLLTKSQKGHIIFSRNFPIPSYTLSAHG